MASFPNTRSTRRIALMMLVFWLGALGAAWANACVLQARGTHGHTAAELAAGAPSVSAGHVGIVDDHTANASPGQAPCFKVCDDLSRSLVKWPSALEVPDLAKLASTALPWSALVFAPDVSRRTRPERPAHTGPPLRTLYSRLTL